METKLLLSSHLNVWVVRVNTSTTVGLDTGETVLSKDSRLCLFEEKVFAVAMTFPAIKGPYCKASGPVQMKMEAMSPIFMGLKPSNGDAEMEKESTNTFRTRFHPCTFQKASAFAYAYRINVRGHELLVTAPASFVDPKVIEKTTLEKHVKSWITGCKSHFTALFAPAPSAATVEQKVVVAGPRATIKRKATDALASTVPTTIPERLALVKEIDSFHFDGVPSSSGAASKQWRYAIYRQIGISIHAKIVKTLDEFKGSARELLVHLDTALSLDPQQSGVGQTDPEFEAKHSMMKSPEFKVAVMAVVLSRISSETSQKLKFLEANAAKEGERRDVYHRFQLDAAEFAKTQYYEEVGKFEVALAASQAPTVPSPTLLANVPNSSVHPEAHLHADCIRNTRDLTEMWISTRKECESAEDCVKHLKVTVDVKDDVIAKLKQELAALRRPSPVAAPAMIDSLKAEVEALKKANTEAISLIHTIRDRIGGNAALLVNVALMLGDPSVQVGYS